MSYQKQIFENGDTLTAENLNYMEVGIEEALIPFRFVIDYKCREDSLDEATVDKTFEELKEAFLSGALMDGYLIQREGQWNEDEEIYTYEKPTAIWKVLKVLLMDKYEWDDENDVEITIPDYIFIFYLTDYREVQYNADGSWVHWGGNG